jgi:O-antigen/teichoic acid export membrane protein
VTESRSIYHGIKWVTTSMASAQLVRFVSTIVLARLLAPELFGLVAMANVALSLVEVIREVGVGTALIQRADAGEVDGDLAANTTFWLSLAVSLTVFLAAYAASPLIASFFGSDELIEVLRVLFCGFIFDGFAGTPGALLRKRLEFSRHAAIHIVVTIVGAAISIGLAVVGWGVWSLVFGQLIARIVQMVMVFRAARWRPSFRFDREIARQLVGYGKYIWAFSLVSAVSRSLDQLLIGRLLGATSLGVYSMGVNLCKLPANRINSVVLRITFPVLSRMQKDLTLLTSTFLRTLRHVSIVVFPMGVGLFAVADSFVLSVYGPKWEAMIPVLQILPFYAVSLSVSATTGPVFQAIAKPQVLLYTSILHQVILLAMLFGLADYGLKGICVAVLVPSFVSSAIAFTLVRRYLKIRVGDLLNPLVRAGASSVVMVLAVKAAQHQLGAVSAGEVVELLGSVAVGSVSYVAAAALLNRADLTEFIASVRQVATARGSIL